MTASDNEEERLRSATLQSSRAILLARRRAEEELGKQSQWLRITLASIGDAVISTDAEGRVTFMNGVAESLTGSLQSEAIGRPLPEVFRIVHERTREPGENPALRALREGMVVGLANHTILIAKDGKERPIDDSAAPIRDDSGNAVGAVLVFRDVTDRRIADEVQARLATIVESSQDAIVSKTLDGVIRSWNAGAERLFEYSADEAIGRPITIIIPPDRRDEEYEIFRGCRGVSSEGDLMDLGMPKLNGYDATQRIREQPWGRDMIIIALTGWGQEADRAQSNEAGCDGHLVKPVNISDLESLLTELEATHHS